MIAFQLSSIHFNLFAIEDSNIIYNFQNNTFIRNLRQELKTTVSILLIDKKYFLSIELNDTLNNISDAIGLTIYSNNRPLVSTYISIFNTLWQQVDLYDKIYQIYESLKARDKAQLEFLNVTAHELRNPLQPIIGLIGILSSGNIAVESHDEMLNVIGRNAKKLQRLSEDILDVAKIENDYLKLNKGVFDLNEFVRSIIGDFAEESRKENTKIVINQNINRDNLKEGVFIKADKNRIGQVISNLLSNALKFTKNGTIDISIIKNAIHDNAICVIIKDTGTGISSEILQKIFTKFVTNSSKGTGLGLYISKKIVEAHGGKIWAENNSNDKGATFGFSLPLKNSINLYP